MNREVRHVRELGSSHRDDPVLPDFEPVLITHPRRFLFGQASPFLPTYLRRESGTHPFEINLIHHEAVGQDRHLFTMANGSWLRADLYRDTSGQGIMMVDNMATPPELQGRGYGRALMQAALRFGRRQFDIDVAEMRGTLDHSNRLSLETGGPTATPLHKQMFRLGFTLIEYQAWSGQLVGRRNLAG